MSTTRGPCNTEDGRKNVAEKSVKIDGQAMPGDRLVLDFSDVSNSPD